MSQVVKVLLIEDNRIEARQTQHWLAAARDAAFEVECVDQMKFALERLGKGAIDIVILDLNLPDSRGQATFETLYAEFPDIPIVVLTGEYDEAIGQVTVSKGAQDYLVKKRANSDSLVHMIKFAIARHRAQQEKSQGMPSRKSGRVMAFLGAKGGVGTTTTALNVAVALATKGKSVILVELRPSFGTLAFHLNLQPAKNLLMLLDLPPEKIGQTDLRVFLCKGPSGMWILFGPKADDKELQEIDPLQTEAIIKGLSLLADYLILDLPCQTSASIRAATSLCHFASVVTEREPGSVRAGKFVVKQLQADGIRGNLAGGIVRVGSIIVNRTIYTNYFMSVDEIQSQMGCGVVGIVPNAATENVRALTESVPLVLLEPENDAALGLIEIANSLSSDKASGIHQGQGFALLKTPNSI